MKWFKKVHKPLTVVLAPDTTFMHSIKVTHSYEPRPRPEKLRFRLRSMDGGREWLLPPVQLYGQAYGNVSFPLVFFTERPEDNSQQITLEVSMDYT